MIGLNPVENIIKLIGYANLIKDAQPLNILLMAGAGTGKSVIIKKASNLHGTKRLADLSFAELVTQYHREIASGEIKTLLIPDLIPATTRRSSGHQLISNLNICMEEGVSELVVYNFRNIKLDGPLSFGVVTALTPYYYWRAKSAFMREGGFSSRCVKMQWNVGHVTQDLIDEYVINEESAKEQPYEMDKRMLKRKTQIHVEGDIAVFRKLTPIVERYRQTWFEGGNRFRAHLQTILKAHALSCGREKVTEEDLGVIFDANDFFMNRYTKIDGASQLACNSPKKVI